MSPDQLSVTIAGVLVVSFIVWFFWLKRSQGVRATETSGGYQEAMILVKGGYTPDTIIVRAGRPVRPNFYTPAATLTLRSKMPKWMRNPLMAYLTYDLNSLPSVSQNHQHNYGRAPSCGLGRRDYAFERR